MKKVKVKSGDILQIQLPKDLGFGYAKCINLLEFNKEAQYPILIRIYNYRSFVPSEPLQSIVSKDLILCPLLIAGIVPTLSKGNWKIVGVDPVKDEDKIIPHYKRAEPDEMNPKAWYYLVDADISKKISSSYENVKHLETIGAVGSELVGTKIAMALLQDEGKNIKDYFSLEEYYEKEFYRQVTTIPVYSKQPKDIRGKALQS
jgi:hypothetical protein